MVRLTLSRKITFQSCPPLTAWTYKGRLVQPHYGLYILQEPVCWGFSSPLKRMIRLSLSRKIKFQSCLPLTPWTCNGSVCLALLRLVNTSGACWLCVIEPSEHDRKTRVVQKNHLPKLSATHPLNMQRLIGPGSRWLVLSSRTCFMGFIEPYEDDGKTHFVQKNHIHILKLSTTHPLGPEPAKVDLSSLTMTCTSFKSLFPCGHWTIWTRW